MKYKALRLTLSKVAPELTHSLMYLHAQKRIPHLKEPKTFSDKISWLKLYALPGNELAQTVADKYRVREYVKEHGFGAILVELYGVWDSAESIQFDTLPKEYVLKCNHGCGFNLINPGDGTFDVNAAVHKLNGWMHTDWGLLSAEPHYSSIPRRVICEQFVSGELSDYKFLCFHGKPYCYVVSKRPRGDASPTSSELAFYCLDGTKAPFQRTDHRELENDVDSQPFYFREMLNAACQLSQDFKFARIDFLTNEEAFYFSEITLTPSAGLMPLEPKEWDLKLGEMLHL